jgi:putative dehydrogenase
VIGVVGLGSMGFGAALSAHRRGFVTWGTDPRAEARERFAAEGGRPPPALPELAAACDVVVVLVVNAAQTEDVLFGPSGLAEHLRRGSVVVASATVDPACRRSGRRGWPSAACT